MALAKQLRVLQSSLDTYRDRILELFNQHPDHDLFGSLPGAGEKIAPRLLSEIGTNAEQFKDAGALQSYVGTAPIRFQSGQIHKTLFRRACNKWLRTTVHLWSDLSRLRCPWAQAYYQKQRDEGKSHACALCVVSVSGG